MINKSKIDSLLNNALIRINGYEGVLKKDDAIILETNKRLSEVKKTLSSTELKLKISKRLTFFGVPIAFGGGILFALLLSK